jgi:hypothetical protein
MKNPFNITKLDRRHNGVEHFTHYINYKFYVPINYKVYVPGVTRSFADNCANFNLARSWFWDTFGASCELNMFNLTYQTQGLATEWAWSTDNNNLRIYVTESTLSHFMLAHSA